MSIVKPLYSDPHYSEDYLDLMLDDREFEDVKKSLKVGPLVKLKKEKLNKFYEALAEIDLGRTAIVYCTPKR